MKVVAIIAALTALVLGGMAALPPPSVFGSRSTQAAAGIDVPALQKAIDSKQLPKTDVRDLF